MITMSGPRALQRSEPIFNTHDTLITRVENASSSRNSFQTWKCDGISRRNHGQVNSGWCERDISLARRIRKCDIGKEIQSSSYLSQTGQWRQRPNLTCSEYVCRSPGLTLGSGCSRRLYNKKRYKPRFRRISNNQI